MELLCSIRDLDENSNVLEDTVDDESVIMKDDKQHSEEQLIRTLDELLESDRLLLDEESGNIYVRTDITEEVDGMEVAGYEEVVTDGVQKSCNLNIEAGLDLETYSPSANEVAAPTLPPDPEGRCQDKQSSSSISVLSANNVVASQSHDPHIEESQNGSSKSVRDMTPLSANDITATLSYDPQEENRKSKRKSANDNSFSQSQDSKEGCQDSSSQSASDISTLSNLNIEPGIIPLSLPWSLKPGITVKQCLATKEMVLHCIHKNPRRMEPKTIAVGQELLFIRTPRGQYIQTEDGKFYKGTVRGSKTDSCSYTGTARNQDLQVTSVSALEPSGFDSILSKVKQPFTHGNQSNEPFTEIIEQPNAAFEFRNCDVESLPKVEGLLGDRSSDRKKTFPTIKINNHQKSAIIVVSCVSANLPYRPHPNTLVGWDCKKGVCTREVGNPRHVTYQNLFIRRARKVDVEENLKEREKIRVDPFGTGFAHRGFEVDDLDLVRLCFQVFLPSESGRYERVVPPVVSQCVFNIAPPGSSRTCSCEDLGTDDRAGVSKSPEKPGTSQEACRTETQFTLSEKDFYLEFSPSMTPHSKRKVIIPSDSTWRDVTPTPDASSHHSGPSTSADQDKRSCISSHLMPVLLKVCAVEPEAIPFRHPVDTTIYQDYKDLIKRPMDFGTIMNKLIAGQYSNPWDLIDDAWLVFVNAWTYNQKSSRIYRYTTKVNDIFTNEINGVMQSLGYCCGMKYWYTPKPLECSGKESCTVEREDFYHWFPNGLIYCENCFSGISGEMVRRTNKETNSRWCAYKSDFEKRKNVFLDPEPFVDCKECSRKFHKICVLHFEQIWTDGFICQNCLKEKGLTRKENKFTAKRLPKCKLSSFIEDRVNLFLKERSATCKVHIRVLSSVDKFVVVQPKMKERYVDSGRMAASFPYRYKSIFAFEEIDGDEVCFFGLTVQEYGSDCPQPNSRQVHISFVDSVHFFQPSCLRTSVYMEILHSYLKYVKKLGYIWAHIWVCPVKGPDNEFIFHCRPQDQKLPKQRRLQEWYRKMLDKAIITRTIVQYKDIFKHCKEQKITSAKDLPYLDEGYWPHFLEEAIEELEEKDSKEQTKENTGDIEQAIENIGDMEQTTENTGDLEQTIENTGNQEQTVENTGDMSARDMEQTIENTGDMEQTTENTGDLEQTSENTGDQEQAVENTGNMNTRDMEQTIVNNGDMEQTIENTVDLKQTSGNTGDLEQTSENTRDTEKTIPTRDMEQTCESTWDQEQTSGNTVKEKKTIENTGFLSNNNLSDDTEELSATRPKRMKMAKESEVNKVDPNKSVKNHRRSSTESSERYEDDELSRKLFETMETDWHLREPFLVAQLQRNPAEQIGPTQDPDPPMTCALTESLENFLTFADENKYEFSSLRRAKYSTLCFLYEVYKQRQEIICDRCDSVLDLAYWCCSVCQDFILCDTCFKNENHNHVMVHLKNTKMLQRSLSVDTTESQEILSSTDGQDPQVQNKQASVQMFVHACQCKDANCHSQECRNMKQIVTHSKTCLKKSEHLKCPICEKTLVLSMYHAKQCQEIMCPVIFCSQIKQTLKFQSPK